MKVSSMENPLDRIDRKLLELLQQDASLPNLELAERTHLSPPACSRRVARLRASGVIRKTVALADPRALGYTGLVIIGVVLDRSTPDSFAAFEKAAAKLTGCLEVQLVGRVRLFREAAHPGHRLVQRDAQRAADRPARGAPGAHPRLPEGSFREHGAA